LVHVSGNNACFFTLDEIQGKKVLYGCHACAMACILAAFMHRLISLVTRFFPRPLLQRLARPLLWPVRLMYRGRAVVCPICGGAFRRFLPYGRSRSRSNALCPKCLSLERHRLLWLYLKERAGFFNHTLRILHIAPELCFLKPFEQQHGSGYVTADLESPWASVKMDIQHMPFADNSFDVVLCNHVLEHVPNDRQALKEIHRVLVPGGYAVLQVPFYHPVPEYTIEDFTIVKAADREKYFGQADHLRRYGKDYLNRISQAGLQAREIAFAEQLGEEVCRKHGLVPTEKIYIGIK
jgi:SAM-dependent methyltransferase